MVYFNQNYNIFDERQKKWNKTWYHETTPDLSRDMNYFPDEAYQLLWSSTTSFQVERHLFIFTTYPCRIISGSLMAHTATKRYQSTANYIFYVMETSSGQYKVYTAKRLLQNRTIG